MTKIQLNENELIQIVEAAAKNALSKILNEGAGLNTMKQIKTAKIILSLNGK